MNNNINDERTIEQREADEVIARREKILAMKENNLIPYKDKFDRTHTIEEARSLKEDSKCRICGRIVGRRGFGKLMFLDLFDVYAKIQLELTLNNLGEEKFAEIKKYMDIGDFVGVEGEIFYTKVGELTVRCFDFTILSKALRPLPEKFHGVKDDDIRYRQRYLDCIANESTRETLKNRIKTIKIHKGV